MDFLYEDCKSLLEQVNLQEKELRHKRRWLIGLPTSRNEAGKLKGSKYHTERPIPEYMLREDDVSYETIKSFVEKITAEQSSKNKNHSHEDDMQLIHSPKDITSLFSLINNMTNQGLFQFAEALTGGTIKFEKTRLKMKQIIKKHLLEDFSKQTITQQKNFFEHHSSLLKNPQNYRWTNESRFIPDSDSDSHISIVHKILETLENLPTQTLSAMHRKLRCIKSYTPKLIPKKSGWRRETLIKTLRKKCYKMLSKLKKGDSLQEPLAKAMEVASLTLKLIQKSRCITNFIKSSPEIITLQNQIALAIQLLDQKAKFSVLKDIQVVLDPKANLSDKKLRTLIRNLLMEYLFECGDMDSVPQCLLKVLAIIRKKCKGDCRSLKEIKIEEEVECILSVSASMKQVLWDMNDANELDLEFADAYMENLEESEDDDDICEDIDADEKIEKNNTNDNNMSDISNLDEEVGSTCEIKLDNFNSVEISECMVDISNTFEIPNSQGVNMPRYHLVSLKNVEKMDVDGEIDEGQSCNLVIDDERRCKNKYLGVQATSDEASMLAYGLIGCILNDFAQIEGCELKSGDLAYLEGESYVLKQKNHRASRKEAATHEEDEYSILFKAVEELIPSFDKCEANRLKELMS